jgi:hypothetical protein
LRRAAGAAASAAAFATARADAAVMFTKRKEDSKTAQHSKQEADTSDQPSRSCNMPDCVLTPDL